MNGPVNYLLRVEAVNLSSVIDDTNQLSVRRGGGLMVLNAATSLCQLLPDDLSGQLQEVATGASIGLFGFSAAGPDEAESLRQQVESVLTTGSLAYESDGSTKQLPLCHATFVVDIVCLDDCTDVQAGREQAVAMNRWRQMQQPSFSLHGLFATGDTHCDLDRTRVATTIETLSPDRKNIPLSDTVADRWHYGRGARQQFYRRQLAAFKNEPDLTDLSFTDDLHQLSGRPAGSEEELTSPGSVPERLWDKIAVFYVDGNGFGAKGADILQRYGLDGYGEWSEALKHHHRGLLKGLVQLAGMDPAWKNDDDIRLETLLWGGDEILWVVPAWKGWEVAEWFYHPDRLHQVTVVGHAHELTYACGLVFCHMNAPIGNITRLAHELGDQAKRTQGQQSQIAYEVLESYDDIAGDLDTHRNRFVPQASAAQENATDCLLINPACLSQVLPGMQALASSSDFPQRQLYRLVSNWRKGSSTDNEVRRLTEAMTSMNLCLEDVLPAPDDSASWQHLLQMLPYIV